MHGGCERPATISCNIFGSSDMLSDRFVVANHRGVVQKCVVDSWGEEDRTARRVWAAADIASAIPAPGLQVAADAGYDAAVAAAAAAAAAKGRARRRNQHDGGIYNDGELSPAPAGTAETAGDVPEAMLPLLLHHDVSARAAADLGQIVDAVDEMCASLENEEQARGIFEGGGLGEASAGAASR